MKVYRLVHKDYNGEVVFGLPFPYNQLEGEKKINYLFSKFKPWRQCIPYYKGCKFGFISKDALMSFLHYDKSITEQEYNDIIDKFYIESFEVSAWSAGLSKYLCTYFDDEIDTSVFPIEHINLNDLKDYDYKYVAQSSIYDEDIKLVKERYYQNIKTYY